MLNKRDDFHDPAATRASETVLPYFLKHQARVFVKWVDGSANHQPPVKSDILLQTAFLAMQQFAVLQKNTELFSRFPKRAQLNCQRFNLTEQTFSP